MDKYFSSDKPISTQKDDRFQRYDFAKRIADTVFERENEDCLVIGVYGAWGEGKTSVINFIERELVGKDNVITIKFNPWRYNDEDSLLKQFFQEFALALDTKLKTKKEEVGFFLKKYGEMLHFNIPIVGDLGNALKNAGGLLDNDNIESLKDRLEDILRENKSKIVIFIDDIDRLDKIEIQSVFRLVKLTADFSNTTYILSFDDEMVSAAIGDRFGFGDTKSGQNFLEKIIQVPLKIPVAQPEALKDFCFELIYKAMNLNNIRLTDNEIRRFESVFIYNVLIKLDTPRLAVRYSNTLSFSMPLLFGEVNIVDLMLIEAIKIFYPGHYQFIKSNPEYFINSYSKRTSHDKENDLKEHLEQLGKGLSKKLKSCIQILLQELFPYLNKVFNNESYDDSIINEWYKHKRIVSPNYFNNYFSYAVIKGELSDISFRNFLIEIPNMSNEEIVNSIKALIGESSHFNFLLKIESMIEDFDWKTSIRIAKGISSASDLFPKLGDGKFNGFDTPFRQAALFVYKIIINHSDKEERFTFAKEIISETKSFEFAFELISWFESGKFNERTIFLRDQELELASIMIEKGINEADEIPIFEKFPDNVDYIFRSWALIDKKGLTTYIRNILNQTPQKCIDLLRSFIPIGYSTTVVGPYKLDLSEEQYRIFGSIFNNVYINKIINKVFTNEEIFAEEAKWNHEERVQPDLNMVRQFRHWLDKETYNKKVN